MSNDTDTFALLLHFTPHFQALGLKEIWQPYGTGEKRRMLPLHQAIAQLKTPLAKTMIKAHILTGDDCMSKVETKHAAVACDPIQYLTNFGETEQDEALAEKYLVRVWAGDRSTTTTETFDQLRLENYTSASAGIDFLHPTSSVIKGHIRRGAFLVHRACKLLANIDEPETQQAPVTHGGWEEHLGKLLPSKCLKPLPQSAHIVQVYRKVCHSTLSLLCCGVLCVTFCHGKADTLPCENLPRND